MADELPRVICDQCLKDVEVGPVVGPNHELVRLTCHDRMEIITTHALTRSGKPKVLWADLEGEFQPDFQLEHLEARHLHEMLGKIEVITAVHEIRRSRGAAPTVIPRVRIDAAIDALMLFRTDP